MGVAAHPLVDLRRRGRRLRLLAAGGQLALVAVVLALGSRWVVRPLANGGHVHFVLGFAGSSARLAELTAGVPLSRVLDSLRRDDAFVVLYCVALLLATIGKDGLRIRRFRRLYFNLRILAVMTACADLTENVLLTNALRQPPGLIGLTYTSDIAAELVRAAATLKWTCLTAVAIGTVVRLGATLLPQATLARTERLAGFNESMFRTVPEPASVDKETETDRRTRLRESIGGRIDAVKKGMAEGWKGVSHEPPADDK